MKGFDTLSIIRFIKSIILSASFELQNCVKISSHTSEPANQFGSYTTKGYGAPYQKAHESASFHLLTLVNQNQDLSFIADTRKYRGVAINSTRLTWVLTKDIATAIK